MAVGLIKMAIPIGGIVGPLLFSALTFWMPFTGAVALFPALYLVGALVALSAGGVLKGR